MNVFTSQPLLTGPAIVTRRDVDKFSAFSIGHLAPLREPFTLTSFLLRVVAGDVPTGLPRIDGREMWRVGFAGVDVTLYAQAAADFELGSRDDLLARWHSGLAQALPTQLTRAALSSYTSNAVLASEDWDLEAVAGAFRHAFGDRFAFIAFKTGQRSASVPCEHQFNAQHFDEVYLHLAVTFASEDGNWVAGWSENNPQFRQFWNRATNYPTTLVGHMNRSSSSAPRGLQPVLGCLTYCDWKVYESWIRLFRRHLTRASTRRAAANTGNFDRRAQLADAEAKQRLLITEATDQVLANNFSARVELGLRFSPADLADEGLNTQQLCEAVWQQLAVVFGRFVVLSPSDRMEPVCNLMRRLSGWCLDHSRLVFQAFTLGLDGKRHSLLTNPDWLGLETVAVMEGLLQAITSGDARKSNPYNSTFAEAPLNMVEGLLDRFFDATYQPPSLQLGVAHHPAATAVCWHLYGGHGDANTGIAKLRNRLPRPPNDFGDLVPSLCATFWQAFKAMNHRQLNGVHTSQAFMNRETLVHYAVGWVLGSAGRGSGGNNELKPLLNFLSALIYRVSIVDGPFPHADDVPGLNPQLQDRVHRLLLEHFPGGLVFVRKPGSGSASRVPISNDELTCFAVNTLVQARFRQGRISPLVHPFVFPAVALAPLPVVAPPLVAAPVVATPPVAAPSSSSEESESSEDGDLLDHEGVVNASSSSDSERINLSTTSSSSTTTHQPRRIVRSVFTRRTEDISVAITEPIVRSDPPRRFTVFDRQFDRTMLRTVRSSAAFDLSDSSSGSDNQLARRFERVVTIAEEEGDEEEVLSSDAASSSEASSSEASSRPLHQTTRLLRFFDAELAGLMKELLSVDPRLPRLPNSTVQAMRDRIAGMRIDDHGITPFHYEIATCRALAWYLKRHYERFPTIERKLQNFVDRFKKRVELTEPRMDADYLKSGRISQGIFLGGFRNEVTAFPGIE